MKKRQTNSERLPASDGSYATWEAQKDQWRKGNTSAQAHKALRNKAVMLYIKEHPGCTANEIHAALGHGGFELLQKHRLAFYIKDNANDNARWYLESDRHRVNKLESARRKNHESASDQIPRTQDASNATDSSERLSASDLFAPCDGCMNLPTCKTIGCIAKEL